MVANGAAEYRVGGLERVEHRALSDWPIDVEVDLAVDTGQRPEMSGQNDSNQCSAVTPSRPCGSYSVCTSTDSTAGRSRTIGVQLSPASDDA